MPLLEEILTGLAGAGVGYLQGRSARKQKEQQAETAAQQLQEREKQALYRAILGDENVAASAKNQLLAAIMPEFRQQTEVTTTVPGVQATAKPVQLGRELTASAPSNLPTETDLPQSGVYNEQMGEHVNLLNRLGAAPTAQMIDREAAARDKFSSRTPVGMPTTPRGSLSSEVSLRSGPDSQETETVTTPMEVFQDKPVVAEKKTIDPLIDEMGKKMVESYQRGETTEAEMRAFLPTYQEARRSNDPTKLKLPEKLVKTSPTALEQSLIDERKQSILESQARTRKLLNEAATAGQGKPITQTAKAGFLRQMKKDVESNVSIKAYNQAARYVGLINTVVDDINNRIKSGELAPNRIATDQFVINLWNRVQEPGSVTRIEEFRTTAQGEPIINRLSGLIQKIKSGGAGITVESMNEIKRLANIVGEQLTKDANIDVESYRQLTKEALPGIDENSLDSVARRFSDKDYTRIGDDESKESGALPTDQPITGPNRYKNYIRNQLK